MTKSRGRGLHVHLLTARPSWTSGAARANCPGIGAGVLAATAADSDPKS